MAGIAKQAAVVSLSRFANYGLVLFSPIVLVRLFTVGEFGRYREFLVYSSVLASITAFSIPNSLLFFVTQIRPDLGSTSAKPCSSLR